MTGEWWHWAILLSAQAFWTIFAVSLGANVVNRSRSAEVQQRGKPEEGP